MNFAHKLATGTAVLGGVLFGAAAPAFADSVTVSPASAAPGATVTITVSCDAPKFAGAIDGGGAFANIAGQNASATATLTGAPGTYTVKGECQNPPESDEFPETTLTITSAPAPSNSPAPMPSGAPKTGGGSGQTSETLGMTALLLAGATGAGLIMLRRRNNRA